MKKNSMKKIATAAVVTGAAALGIMGTKMVAAGAQGFPVNYYPKTAVVVAFGVRDDLVVAEDANGQRWCFTGIEDYCIGDMVSMIMDDMGTDIIYDDEIVNVRYSGYWDTKIFDSVVDWEATDSGIILRLENGSGYHIKK